VFGVNEKVEPRAYHIVKKIKIFTDSEVDKLG